MTELKEVGLRMVRGASQIRIENPATTRGGTTVGSFHRHEYGVNAFEHARVIHFQDPSVSSNIVHIEQAQTFRLAVRRLAITPCLKSSRGAVVLLILQIEGVEDQQLFLDVIDAPVAAAGVPFDVHVVYIHDVEIACAEEFFGFGIAESLGFRRGCGLLLDLQLC